MSADKNYNLISSQAKFKKLVFASARSKSRLILKSNELIELNDLKEPSSYNFFLYLILKINVSNGFKP